jgi:hypothetical protein
MEELSNAHTGLHNDLNFSLVIMAEPFKELRVISNPDGHLKDGLPLKAFADIVLGTVGNLVEVGFHCC